MSINALRRVQRWFWALTTTAVLAAGVLYQGLRSAPGPGTGLLVLASALLLAASAVQAARILTVLAGPPRLPKRRRTPGPQPTDRGGHEHGRER
ncbi:hypothetical protein [Streptomyces virginiae]|uniref:hypothetical protein n=1 Tax=Streptomyces virginiae TaxID=1961 RepID=UPI00225684E4|nr:hypothetical protein [Streptomyces virginiae]MCX5275375.1 hypothetical protein [Streptomyces virginiae]